MTLGVLTLPWLGAGSLSGLLGMGGTFLLAPLLTTVTGVPIGAAGATTLMTTEVSKVR